MLYTTHTHPVTCYTQHTHTNPLSRMQYTTHTLSVTCYTQHTHPVTGTPCYIIAYATHTAHTQFGQFTIIQRQITRKWYSE